MNVPRPTEVNNFQAQIRNAGRTKRFILVVLLIFKLFLAYINRSTRPSSLITLIIPIINSRPQITRRPFYHTCGTVFLLTYLFLLILILLNYLILTLSFSLFLIFFFCQKTLSVYFPFLFLVILSSFTFLGRKSPVLTKLCFYFISISFSLNPTSFTSRLLLYA